MEGKCNQRTQKTEAMTRYATNIENDGGCPDCDSYERKIDRMNAKMADLESQLSSKEQELTNQRAKWKEERDFMIKDAQRGAEYGAEILQKLQDKEQECEKWRNLADEHSAKALEFSDSLRDVRAENERLKEQKYEWFEEHQTLSEHYINLQSEQKTLRKRCEDLEAQRKAIMFNAWAAARNYDFIENIQCAISELDKTEFDEWYKLLSQ